MSWDSARAAERVARAYAAPDLAAVRERQIDLLAPQPGWRIADIGCGPGRSPRRSRAGREGHRDRLRARDARRVGRPGLGCELVEADALSLPLADGSHDAACLVQVLEYVDDPVAALREAARVVRAGGAGARRRHRLGHAGLQRRRPRARPPRRAGLGRRQARRLGGPAPARLADGGRPRARGALRRRARRDGVGRRHVHRAQLAVLPARPRALGPRFRRRSRPLRAPRSTHSAASGAFYWSVVRHAWRARVPPEAYSRRAPRGRRPSRSRPPRPGTRAGRRGRCPGTPAAARARA